jgi:hypothetical protein
MQKLHIDDRGYPVPYFVAWVDGKPEFRIADNQKWARCVRAGHCWVCGDVVGKFKTFVIGPMCAVNRTTSEPPCHLECAVFSATACPFLTLPKAQRRDANMPEGNALPGGICLMRNPGVTCLWTTLSYQIMDAGNGYLFRIGDPTDVQWYAQKRPATREEILESIDSGMPLLREQCEKEDTENRRAQSHALLDGYYARMLPLLPATARCSA